MHKHIAGCMATASGVSTGVTPIASGFPPAFEQILLKRSSCCLLQVNDHCRITSGTCLTAASTSNLLLLQGLQLDVRDHVPVVRAKVLQDCRLLLTRLIPLGMPAPHTHPLWRLSLQVQTPPAYQQQTACLDGDRI